MSNLTKWHNDMIGQRAVDALNKNNFNARYFANRRGSVDYVLQHIPQGAII